LLGKVAHFLAQAFTVSLFRAIALLILIAVLAWLGWTWAAQLLAGNFKLG
jgi:hypothetical protein